MEKTVTIYYDKEADYLEVIFEKTVGYFRETENDAVMEKVSNDNRLIGFSIINVSDLASDHPLNVQLSLAS
ncbi:MAG: hypothetical protein SFU99_20085 [Saprospiraceae bacterium]|nr:hypothetical protein [Saprospiraceae bacterium]